MKKIKRTVAPLKDAPNGFWRVTPLLGNSCEIKTTKELVEFLKKNNSCIVSWIKTK